MSESRVLAEIEAACSHHRICVLPRNPKRLSCSVWAMPDPAYHAGVIWRVNTGASRFGRRFVRFGLPGTPDFQGWRFTDGRRIVIEAKEGLGKETPDQHAHALLAIQTNVLHGIVRSYDDCARLLQSWGFNEPK